MYGAILGDIIGSPYEFEIGPSDRYKEFELFSTYSIFTDDSVMTIAVADALLNVSEDASIDEIKDSLIKSMKKWGQKYPDVGYGAAFYQWMKSDDTEPYGSWGNGSAREFLQQVGCMTH